MRRIIIFCEGIIKSVDSGLSGIVARESVEVGFLNQEESSNECDKNQNDDKLEWSKFRRSASF